MIPSPPRVLAVLAAVAVGLVVTTACQVVEPAPHAHTEDIPVRKQSTVGILYGAHSKIACEGCHIDQPPPYAKVADDCMECHKADRRKLHPLGKDHMPDAKTCGGSGCHSVGHFKWSDWIKGTEPITTDTNDTAPETGTDTGEPTNCLLGPSTVQSCAGSCHGETIANGAPADGTHAAHTDPAVATFWTPNGQQNDCATCHPAGNDAAPTHFDCTVDITLQGAANLGWAADWAKTADPLPDTTGVPTYVPATATCSNIYCHGYGLADLPDDPVWSDPTDGDCGSCHGIEPTYAAHSFGTTCGGNCHGDTTEGDAPATIANPSAHVNGQLYLFGSEL